MVHEQPPTFFFQETHFVNSQTPKWSSDGEPCKTVPEGIRDHECKRFPLSERPLVPYVPEKDPIQETVAALKNVQSLKTTIGEDTELGLPIWHCGMHEAFLMHVSMALNAIQKQGTFKACAEAHAL